MATSRSAVSGKSARREEQRNRLGLCKDSVSGAAAVFPIVADLLVALRLPIENRQAVLAWAKDQPGQPNLSEALRRLIDIGLGSAGATRGKTPQRASDEPDSQKEAVRAGPVALTPTAPEQPPKGTAERLAVKAEQTTHEVRWTPRIVEATSSSAPTQPTTTPEAQTAIDPVEVSNPYQMPEDLKAFNEYWPRIEHGLGRQLSYEEVIVLFNQDRQAPENI